MASNSVQTRDFLANEVWRACHILRRDNNCGGIMEYVEHLAWLLFLRFLDAQETIWAQEAAIDEHPYTRILDAKLRWEYWGKRDWDADDLIAFVHGTLLPGLQALRGDPFRDTIRSIFSERTVIVAASGYNLKDVLEIINKIDFTSQDDIFTVSKVYEDLLQRLGNENRMAGEFYTPRPVIRFIVQLVAPQLDETVYDPAAGSAGFLAQAFEYLRNHNPERTIEQDETLQMRTFFGNEKKAVPALLGLMNLALHGVTVPRIERRNTLEEEVKSAPAERFDVVVTNPPFGGTENRQIQRNFPVQANATELLFLEHIMKKLKPRDGARCGMVMPEGTLFRRGTFATVKQTLLDDFNLHTVVSLPPGTFAPYSDVKTALLFFERPGPTHETWYYELPLPEGLKKFSKGSPIEDEHLDEARSLWQSWRQYLDGTADRPFEYAADIRERWRVHQLWEAYRNDEENKIERPMSSPTDTPVAQEAHGAEGPRPPEPYTVWIEKVEDLKARGYDLGARNPNRNGQAELPPPAELTASLLERVRELHSIVANLHEMVGDGDEEID
jgi:type I restriction enzyme M protein